MKRSSLLAKLTIPAPVTIALFTVLSYGLLIPWLGLYADDWTFIWTFETLQSPGILRYFTLGGNRPIWGLFYNLFVPMLGHKSWAWHIFAIFWLWLCAVLVWYLVRLVWKGNQKTALMAALFFAVYPGLKLQYISLTFGHMWLVYAALLGSLCCSLQAYYQPRRYLIWSAAAVLLSAINLLSFEYFIMLELLRPVLFWIAFTRPGKTIRPSVFEVFKAWLPYMLLFIGVIVWRSFFFVLQTIRYQFSLISAFKTEPLQTLASLIPHIAGDIFWQTTLRAWGEAFLLPFKQDFSALSDLAAAGLLIVAMIIAYFALYLNSKKAVLIEKTPHTAALKMAAAGLIALFCAGVPFWMTGLVVEPVWWNSRFTMPFILGAALLFTGLIHLLPWQPARWASAALMIGVAVGSHFQIANDFRVDWINHNTILRQLNWRIPSLQTGTTLLSNDLPLKYFSDNTFSAEINWIQSKGQPDDRMNTYWAYISEMVRIDQPVQTDEQIIHRDMISADFVGSTGQMVGLYYRSGSCLRVLDPRYDPLYFRIQQDLLLLETRNDPETSLMNEELANAALLTNQKFILPQGNSFDIDPTMYGHEEQPTWCYYYEKADLARQQGDWQAVANYADQIVLKPVYLKRDPMLSGLFIEGYARSGDVQRGVEISKEVISARPDFQPIVCQVWKDLEQFISDPLAIAAVQAEISCYLSN